MTDVITIILFYLLFFTDLFAIVGSALLIVRVIPKEKDTARYLKILAWIGYALLAMFLPYFRNDVMTTIILLIYYILLGRILYYRNKIGILYQIIYWMLFLSTQYAAAFVLYAFFQTLSLTDLQYQFFLVLFRITFLLLATYTLRTIILKRYTKGEKYIKIRGMIIIPIFSMALVFMYVSAGEIFFLRFGYGWLCVYCLLLMIINLYCLYFWYDVSKNGTLKQQLKLMTQQNELTLQYYQDLEDNYNHSRKIIHDIRNHLSAIEQANKIENSQYIEDVHAMLNSLGMKFYTENRMLNIVLNDKLKAFPSEQVECRLGGINLGFISDMDITTIFANLLDNALESQPNETTRTISIKGEQILDFIVIKLTNPSTDCYKEGCSSKKGHEGLGLQNVKSALEKYQGELQLSQIDNIFSVTIAFPNNTIPHEMEESS